MSSNLIVALGSIVVASCLFAGCDTSPNTRGSNASAASEGNARNGDEATAGGSSDTLAHDADQAKMAEARAELSKLPSDDAASAEKQRVCPVSGELLGTMGTPMKVDVNGRLVWICCAGCKDSLLEKPDDYLAKMPKE